VLILDDIITAGTAINEAYEIISEAEGIVAGIVIALDRQEKGTNSTKSAVQTCAEKFKVPIMSIVDLETIIDYLSGQLSSETMEKIKKYKAQYGA
jgi:orotate phosphoribosyltransferase